MLGVVGITGASGVIGSILRRRLEDQGVPVSCFEGDIADGSQVKAWITEASPSQVFHLAAIVPTSVVRQAPLAAFKVNAGGTLNLLEALGSLGRQVWMFYASTAHVYGSSPEAIQEGAKIDPISLYGRTKLWGEELCRAEVEHGASGMKVCIGRIFSFYHQTQSPPFLYPTILDRLSREDLAQPFFLPGADSVRDFLNAEQVVDLMVALMKRRSTGVFNIGSGQGTTIRDFVQSMTDARLQIITDQQRDVLVADISRLNAEIGAQA